MCSVQLQSLKCFMHSEYIYYSTKDYKQKTKTGFFIFFHFFLQESSIPY